jgi:hypothetical protein
VRLSVSLRTTVSFILGRLIRQSLPPTRVIREFADPYGDDEVTERHERVQGARKQNPIAEKTE